MKTALISRMRVKNISIPLFIITVFWVSVAAAEEVAIFNGKDLSGWETVDPQYWSVENGVIKGSSDKALPRNTFIWSKTPVEDFYLSVDVKLELDNRNAGIQFRSVKHGGHEALGYQADVGQDVWGRLYHESGRGKLDWRGLAEKHVKKGDWNHYEILAVGHRIWAAINGHLAFYTHDPQGELKGYIALQIHGGPAQTVRYRINKLVHDPDIKLAGKDEAALNQLIGYYNPLARIGKNSTEKIDAAYANRQFTIKPHEMIVFTGGANLVREQEFAYLETLLASHYKKQKPKFRNMAWSGDTVYRQMREGGWGSMKDQLNWSGATAVLMQFGKMESLEGDAAMDNFIDHYGKLIEQLKQRTERITLISPFPFEAPRSKDAKDLSRHNKVLSNYVMAIAALAENKNIPFVDVFSPFLKHSEPLTNDGIHLSKKGWQVAAPFLAKELGAGSRTDLSQLTKAIQVKNRFWFDCWRPINWTFASSYLRNQAFRNPAGGFPELGNEFTRFKPFISKAEENIHLIALKKKPNLIEYPYRGVAEATQDPNETLKSFRVRDGFEVNVFASEKNGVINPVDMCWDAKGRLWVICSPMYPQIMPGEIAYDYILVCEDTNNDGKADKFHKYLEGLNMPMGLCLGHDGLYVTYNTQLLHYKDNNGDGKADDKEIILEGFGTGDAHHTINTPIWGPNGKLWISQGYNSYSYVESIDGVKSLSGGSTWRYDPRTLQLDNFFNNNGVGGNPRTVIFDQNDQPFLNDAPGDASHFLTPGLQPGGTKLPYEHGLFKNGGKNGGLCFLDSSHFPEEHRGKAVGGGYYVNRIQLYNRVDKLAGYTTQPEQEIVFSPQKSFRVIDVNMGPDGALYAMDWHNAVIGHYQASYRDPNRDHGHGRIWRVTYKGRPLVKKIDLSQLSIKELLARVNSQESWTRYQSRRLLFHKTSAEILPVLKQWCQQDLDPMQTRSALGLYTAHVSTNLPLLKKALTSKDAATRAFATQTIGHWGTQLDHPLSLLKPMVHDANARVRLEAVVALGWSKEGAAIEVATEVLNYDFGLQLEIALKSCMRSLKQYWLPAFMKGELLFNNNKKQLGFFLAHAPDINIQTLKKIALSLPDEQKINILVSIAHAGDLDDIPFILEHGHKNTRVLKALVTEAQLSDNAGLFTQYAPSKIKLIECSSQNTNIEDGRGLNAFDGNPQSSWHSQWSGARPPHPHHVTVELESTIELNGFSYLPRVDGRPGGVVDKFEVHTSLDNKNWALAKKGRFENILQNRGIHSIAFEQPVKAKYFKFTSISAINNDLYGGAAEIGLLSKNADEDIVKLLLASIEAGQKDALRLAGYWKLETLLPLLSEKATAISSDLNTVKASVEGLALLGDSKTILKVIKNNEKARSHSLAQLVSCDLNLALAYARNWAPTITSQNDFTLFFAAVSKQEGGILKMVENFKSIAFSDQNKLAARHAVGRIGLESNELITLFGDNAKDSVGLIEYDKAWLDSFVKSVGKGNAQKGETLYDTKLAACASCHQIGNIGGKLGPPLTSIGTGMTTSLIVESVLWPDRQVKEGYESAVMSLHSGKTILGNIVHETKNEVTLKEVATETEHVVKTSQIKSFKKTGSIMPKGMVAHLTKEELRDLLKYLGELKGAGTTFSKNNALKRPNILFICTDDQGAWALGASGNTQAITPNMDRLAAEGAYLVNSFVTTGVCSPSRAATLTSQYGYEVGVNNWLSGRDFEKGMDLKSINFVEVLQQSGYHTALIGKWHLGMHDKFYPTNQGFDYFMGHRHGGFKVVNPTLERNGKKINFKGLTADILADDAISFMESHISQEKDKPFFLAWHTRAPHTEWLPVSESDARPYGKGFDPVLPDRSYPNLDVTRVEKMMTEYLSSTRSVDRNLGRVMKSLKELGLKDNTIVIYTSDHGYNVGHNGIWHKGNGYHTLTKNPVDSPAVAKNMKSYMRPNAFDTSIRVPTFIRWPGVIKSRSTISETTSNLDWYPTVLAMAGVEIPRGKVVRGNNLLPFLKGDEPADWDDDFYTYLSFGKHIDYTFTAEIRALRTPKYKLVRDFANPELHEFYDLRNDPGEHRNLIGSENPKIKKIIEELDKKICAKMEETNDPVLENKKENTE